MTEDVESSIKREIELAIGTEKQGIIKKYLRLGGKKAKIAEEIATELNISVNKSLNNYSIK